MDHKRRVKKANQGPDTGGCDEVQAAWIPPIVNRATLTDAPKKGKKKSPKNPSGPESSGSDMASDRVEGTRNHAEFYSHPKKEEQEEEEKQNRATITDVPRKAKKKVKNTDAPNT